MNCKDFQYWLSTKDTDPAKDNPEILNHLEGCKSCRKLYTIDTRLEKDIKTAFYQKEVPEDIYDHIELTIDHASCPVPAARLKLAGFTAALFIIFAASYLIFFNKPFQYKSLQQLSEQAVAKHLKGDTYMSFSANEIEAARERLSSKLHFNVIIPDLADKGYTLLGGRLCILGKCKIVYLFFEKRKNRCSLFIMGYDHLGFELADGSRFNNIIKGCHTDIWKERGQVYAMVY